MNTEIIHLSDLHIGRGKEILNNLIGIRNYIRQYHPDTPVLITGDVTESGTEKQFQLAEEWLSNLAMSNPILAVPGNHDYAFKGFIPIHSAGTNFQRWYEHVGYPMGWGGVEGRPNILPGYWSKCPDYPAFEGYGRFQVDDYTQVFYVDSGDPERKVRCARGWVSETMCDILAQELETYSSYTRIVMLHHHPFDRGLGRSLEGTMRFMDTVDGNCELLLFGHKHIYGVWRKDDLHQDMVFATPLILASHRTTEGISGKTGAITVISLNNVGTKQVEVVSRVEMFDLRRG